MANTTTLVLLTILLVSSVRTLDQSENEIAQTATIYRRLAKLLSFFVTHIKPTTSLSLEAIRQMVKLSNNTISRCTLAYVRSFWTFTDLRITRALATLMRTLSKEDIFSIITTIVDIPKNINYSAKNFVNPVFVILIKSTKDFETLANVTSSINLSAYRAIMIIAKNLMDCNEPVGNPLHLEFDTKILVVCQEEPVVHEWYSLKPNETIAKVFFAWADDAGEYKRLTNLSLYARRNSLEGKSLRVTALEEARMTAGHYNGYFGKVLSELASVADFTIDLQPDEKVPGSYNPKTKDYSGIIGKLHRGMTDIGVGELTISKKRQEVCDFTRPMIFTEANFYISKPSDYHLMWSMYYYAFGTKASYCLLLFLVFSPIIIAVLVCRYNRFTFAGNVYENYLNVWGIFCSKSSSDFPEQWSARIAYYSLYVLSFMLYSAYSALLVSYLANLNPDLPFHSLREFIVAKTHKITTLQNTSYTDTFKISYDMSMRKLNSFLLDDKELPLTLMEAVDQACDRSKKVVLYIDDVILYDVEFIPACELIPFERNRLASMAFAFPKHSPYVGLMNYHLERLRSAGLLNAIKNQNYKRQKIIPVDYKPVDLYSTIPAFGILCIGMALSAILVIIENIFFFIASNDMTT